MVHYRERERGRYNLHVKYYDLDQIKLIWEIKLILGKQLLVERDIGESPPWQHMVVFVTRHSAKLSKIERL